MYYHSKIQIIESREKAKKRTWTKSKYWRQVAWYCRTPHCTQDICTYSSIALHCFITFPVRAMSSEHHVFLQIAKGIKLNVILSIKTKLSKFDFFFRLRFCFSSYMADSWEGGRKIPLSIDVTNIKRTCQTRASLSFFHEVIPRFKVTSFTFDLFEAFMAFLTWFPTIFLPIEHNTMPIVSEQTRKKVKKNENTEEKWIQWKRNFYRIASWPRILEN